MRACCGSARGTKGAERDAKRKRRDRRRAWVRRALQTELPREGEQVHEWRNPYLDQEGKQEAKDNDGAANVIVVTKRESRKERAHTGPATAMQRARQMRWEGNKPTKNKHEPSTEVQLEGWNQEEDAYCSDPERGLWTLGMDHNLLTKEEEVQLAERIQAWLNVERTRWKWKEDSGVWPDEETLAKAMNSEVEDIEFIETEGIKARNKLILSNIGLVRKIGRRFEGFYMEPADIVLAGISGLCLAADKYQPQKGTRFSTFAFWCIRMKMRKTAEKESKVMKVSSEFWLLMPKIKSTAAELEIKLQREPTVDEIAQELSLKPTKVRCILNASNSHASLDSSVLSQGDGDASLLSMLAGTKDDAFKLAQAREASEMLNKVLDVQLGHSLVSSIIKLHFGIGVADGRGMRVQEIARELDIGQEVCRCYLYSGLEYLRAKSHLFDFVGEELP